MASIVYAVFSITNVASMHCAMRPEISPCTCEPIYTRNNVEVACQKVDSFHQIINALSNRFDTTMNVSLKIQHSQLDDLEMLSFQDMNLQIVKLRMQWNNLKSLPELPFRSLTSVEYLAVGDNDLEEIPKHTLNNMPNLITFDMSRCRAKSVFHDDLRGAPHLQYLFLASNNITHLESNAFPPSLLVLHLGRNQIENLNGSLRNLIHLETLFVNLNNISSLDDELPESSRLHLLMAHSNQLVRLPQTMRNMIRLDTVGIQCNRLKTLDGIFRNALNLTQLFAADNQIEYLAQDEFPPSLDDLQLEINQIKSLNYSLLPIRRLAKANFSFNQIEEFSMDEIRGLKYLKVLDLSYNRIRKLIVNSNENEIDRDSFLMEFCLNNNDLKSLDGALMGLGSLRILNLAFNKLERILPEDFIGLVKLEILDLSNNELLTLAEMGTTYLPFLKILKAANNNLTKLDKDFHGLPVLCQANLTNNHITSMSTDLISETRCMNHNVPGKLEIYLEDNPIMCDERLNELCSFMFSHDARIRGKSACFENDQEVCTVLPMLFPSIVISDNLPLLRNDKSVVIVQNQIGPLKTTDDLPPIIATLSQPLIKPFVITAPPTTTTTSTTSTTTTTTTSTTTTTVAPPTSTMPNGEEIHRNQEEIIPIISLEQPKFNDEIVVVGDNNPTIPSTTTSTTMATLTTPVAIVDGGDGATNISVIDTNAAIELTNDSFLVECDTSSITTAATTTSTAATSLVQDMVESPALVFDIEEPQLPADPVAVAAAAAATATATAEKTHESGSNSDVAAAAAVAIADANANEDRMSVGDGTARVTTVTVPHVAAEYATVEYIPNLNDFKAGSGLGGQQIAAISPQQQSDVLDEDSKSNLVHEEFPSVVLAEQLENAPSHTLLQPDELPENP